LPDPIKTGLKSLDWRKKCERGKKMKVELHGKTHYRQKRLNGDAGSQGERPDEKETGMAFVKN